MDLSNVSITQLSSSIASEALCTCFTPEFDMLSTIVVADTGFEKCFVNDEALARPSTELTSLYH